MVELNSEPPLYVAMKNDQAPGKWKSQPVHLFILINRTLKQTPSEEAGRKTFHKLPACLCGYFLYVLLGKLFMYVLSCLHRLLGLSNNFLCPLGYK